MLKLTRNHEIQINAINEIPLSLNSLATIKDNIYQGLLGMRKKALSTLLVGVELQIAFL